MKEYPIIFSAPMVRAILDGHKTQTRRILKHRALECIEVARLEPSFAADPENNFSPYGYAGDYLWVRETWQSLGEHDHLSPSYIPVGSDLQYPATYDGWESRRRPSIYMPHWASRITLKITNLRIERLQDISGKDAVAEGVRSRDNRIAQSEYKDLWQFINGTDSWDANPWVWVIEFKRIKP